METAPLTIQRPPRSFRARLLRWAIMSVIFVGGGVAGYCVGTMELISSVTPPISSSETETEKDKFTEWILGKLKKDLTLTDAQYPQVKKILVSHREPLDRERWKFQQAWDAEMGKMDREMLAVLDGPQRELYKKRIEERSRWGAGRPGGGRGGNRRGGDHNRGRDNKDEKERNKDDKSSNGKADAAEAHKDASNTKPGDSK